MAARELGAGTGDDVLESAETEIIVPGYPRTIVPEVDREVSDSVNEDGVAVWADRTDVL